MADGITRIAVEGFKSIVNRQEIEIAPLTILAGANSSGKSSIMQPLLMLKQTLEAQYDPGPLEIDGGNVKFTSSDQFLSRTQDGASGKLLTIEIATTGLDYAVTFRKGVKGMEVTEQRQTLGEGGSVVSLRPKMTSDELRQALKGTQFEAVRNILAVIRKRFLLDIDTVEFGDLYTLGRSSIEESIQNVIHVPGLRGGRERVYKVSATGPGFLATFDLYAASILDLWQSEGNPRLLKLRDDLRNLGVAESINAHRLNETQIDLRVNRLVSGSAEDTVSLADVGFGVSQVLPVLVALRVADMTNLVYVEEPEIHLHPRAQVNLADILADVAKDGVRVVAETHSSLMLRAIQTLVAKGALPAELVKLHWFSRDDEGITQVRSATPDENGAFGDWPEDFGDVALQSEKEYLDAVESKLAR